MKEAALSVDKSTLYILVIDVNDDDRYAASRLLQRFGYNICNASSTTEAMSYMNVALPAAIVAEGSVGIDLVSRLQQDVRFSTIPIIVLANAADRNLATRLKGEKFAASLGKPVEAQALYQAIQAALGNTRRKNIRIATALPALLDDGEERTVSVLSEFGMFFPTKNPRPLNSIVTVDLKIRSRTVKIEAVVLYGVELETSPFMEAGMGLKFMSMSRDDHAFIKSYLMEQMK
jgi:CheY-like chemotaxis protein